MGAGCSRLCGQDEEPVFSSTGNIADSSELNRTSVSYLENRSTNAKKFLLIEFLISEIGLSEFLCNAHLYPENLRQSYLTIEDMRQLSKTNSCLYRFFKPALDNVAATQLVQYVVYGDLENAKKMLDANPELLCYKVDKVEDYSGLFVENATPLQAALRKHDLETAEGRKDGMVEMMLPYFDKLKDAKGGNRGQVECAKQINEEFPHGLQLIETGEDEGLFAAEPFNFMTIVTSIENSSFVDIREELWNPGVLRDTMISHALATFKQEFTKLSQDEEHFNPNHFLTAIRIYRDNYRRWHDEQSKLFLRQVIGYVMRYLPACYAQALVQGLHYLLEEKATLKRSFTFPARREVAYYPLDVKRNSRLGYHCCFGTGRFGLLVLYQLDLGGCWSMYENFLKYIRQAKIPALSRVIASVQQASEHHAVSPIAFSNAE